MGVIDHWKARKEKIVHSAKRPVKTDDSLDYLPKRGPMERGGSLHCNGADEV